MRIVKQGTIYTKFYGRCANCYALIEADIDDFGESYKYEKSFTHKCPACNATMFYFREDNETSYSLKSEVEKWDKLQKNLDK